MPLAVIFVFRGKSRGIGHHPSGAICFSRASHVRRSTGPVAWATELAWTLMVNAGFFHLYGPLMVPLGDASPAVEPVQESRRNCGPNCGAMTKPTADAS